MFQGFFLVTLQNFSDSRMSVVRSSTRVFGSSIAERRLRGK
jgi:hypothetical protein